MIHSDPSNMHRKVKEVIYIELRGATLNRTGGYDLQDLYLTFAEGAGYQGVQERLTGHASTADTTSGMALLHEEAKLLLGEIQEVNSVTLSFKVSDERTINTLE